MQEKDKPVCCSGGALGADLAWGIAAHAAGHDVIHFIFRNHHSTADPKQLHVLTQDQLLVADGHLVKANKTLRRKWPVSNDFVANLLRRNYYQVVYSDSLYAISSFDGYGMVKGGTAWAVQMMIDIHPNAKIYVFDQQVERWFQWKGAWMPSMQPPAPDGLYAAIGSRELTAAGLRAIESIFQ